MWSDVARAFSAGSSCTKEYKHGADVFVDCDEAFIHTNAEEDGGGLACSDVELINSQRRIIIDIGKQLGRKLLSGDLNLINISLPVVMFEPRSYLQKLADPWVHPIHLEKAAACRNPLERMKLTVTWFVAGLQHVFCSWRKPFNPLLGETWQAHLPSGTKIFTEQVSHHPPVTAFHMDGQAGLYTFDGLSQPQVSFNSGGLKTSARGYRRITFAADGAVITIKYPHYKIAGLISGVPRGLIRGTATLTDNNHNITATVTFGPVAGAASRLLNRADSLRVAITGPAAAAAAEIAVPEWIDAVAAERPLSAAADGALIAHDTAAAAAAALLAPVQQTRGNCVQSQRACSLPAACNEFIAQEMHYSTGTTQQLKNSNHSVSSSTCSQDCYMVIDSMQRSKSSNSVISLDWLAKPGKKLGRVGRGTGSSGDGNGNSRHRHSTPGLRLGSCFGSFQVNPSHEDSSSSRSRSVSPGVSRVQSSTACCLADDSFHALHPSIPSHPAAAQHACLDASGVPADGNGVSPADANHSSTATAQHGGKQSAVADGLVQLENNRDTFTTQHTASFIKPRPSLDLPIQECSAQRQGSAVKDTLLPSEETPTAHKLQENQQQRQQRQQKHQPGYAQQPQQLLATGCGNWLSHLDFDDQRYWTLTEDPPEHWVSLHDCQPGQQHEPNSQQLHAIGPEDQQQVAGSGVHQHTHPTHLSSTDQCTLISHQDSQPMSQPHHQHHQDIKDKICPLNVLLPSDSQLRADLAAFRAGDCQAQQVKEELEQQQRQDAKLRPSFQHRDCAQGD